jgi:alpha-1,3/alpha-1,6-mannosyltransferase
MTEIENENTSKKQMRVAFLHPNMTLGGAEQWLVNTAMGLKRMGWYVKVFTPCFDNNRCLEQLRDGSIDLEVRGDQVPKKIFGQFNALCEYIRLTLTAIYLILFGGDYDLIIIDQISAPVPLLRLRFKVFFYSHWPDAMLCVDRQSSWKRVYRFFLDLYEEFTMLFPNEIAVNSKYTQQIYINHFKLLGKFREPPTVIYPCIDVSHYVKKNFTKKDLWSIRGLQDLKSQDVTKLKVMVSLNRYELKKNVMLALKSYLKFMSTYLGLHSQEETDKHILIIAGGYDVEVPECKVSFDHLNEIANISEYKNNIFILKNLTSEERSILLNTANLLMYTPKDEHFGIVPLEGMASGAMVMCHKSGGPLETVNDGITGYLMDNEDELKWGFKLFHFFRNESNFDENGMNNRELKETLKSHIIDNFSVDRMMKEMNIFWKKSGLLDDSKSFGQRMIDKIPSMNAGIEHVSQEKKVM